MIKVKMHYNEFLDGILVTDEYALVNDDHTVFLVKIMESESGYVEDENALVMPTVEEHIDPEEMQDALKELKRRLLTITLFEYLTEICKNNDEFILGLLGREKRE
ncbi:hypothetical protein [Sutcliffiella horikoshii]|uniref:Uncharacterized protein n=1 Tax=Sutcliffiella horikoshii TaxID=79883 RepID=A0A5D4THE6_9BACI|nr:hypothetical protein [Sutcliffiella horikoshii]TYS74539.1 hypothetical protein FZC75_02245 [Sutcliffiella horikoshii]